MSKKNILTKILAVTGTALVWAPILLPIVFGIIRLASGEGFLFDFLIPAELFSIVFVGGVLLCWAALRSQAQRRFIGFGLVAAVALLFGGQMLAFFTGIATGETEPTGWLWGLVVGSLVGYSVAIMAMGIGGILLIRDLLRKPAIDQA